MQDSLINQNHLTHQDLVILREIFKKASHQNDNVNTSNDNNNYNDQSDSMNINQTNNINVRKIAYHIREYVMNNSQYKNIKKRLLDFYLLCQSKLKQHTDIEWKRVFNEDIEKLEQELIMRQVSDNNAEKQSMCKLKPSRQTMFIFENRNLETNTTEIVDFDNIHVDEEIKLKTDCFYKWQKYIQQVKNIKCLKLQQLDNIKKSICFNSYAIKFNTFSGWKRYIKIKRIEEQRAYIIETFQNKRISHQILATINQKIKIRQIQNQLEKLISIKLQELRKLQLVDKLKNNSLNNKNLLANQKHHNSIPYYLFMNYITSELKQIYTKSNKKIRIQSENQFLLLCQKLFFSTVKNRLTEKKKKIQLVYKKNKEIKFKKLIVNLIAFRKYKQHNDKLTVKISNHQKLFGISMLMINKFKNMDTNKLDILQSIQQYLPPLKFKKLINNQTQFLNTIKSIQQKTFKLSKYLGNIKYSHFIMKLIDNHYKNTQKRQIKYCKEYYSVKLVFKIMKQQNELIQTYKKIAQKIQDKKSLTIMKKMFNQFKKIKDIKQIESQSLRIIEKVLQRCRLMKAFDNIKKINQFGIKLEKVNYLIEKIMKIKTIKKIGGRYRYINDHVYNMVEKTKINMKINLFSLLLRNQQIIQNKIWKIQQSHRLTNKKHLIQNLVELKHFKTKIEQINGIITNLQINKFYRLFRQYYNNKQQIHIKIIKIKTKKLIKNLKKFHLENKIIQNQLQRNYNNIKHIFFVHNFKQFTKNINLINIKTKRQDKLSSLIVSNNIINIFNTMRINTSFLKKHKKQSVNMKTSIIQNLRKISLFKQFTLQKKEKKLKNTLLKYKQKIIFKRLKQRNIIQSNKRQLRIKIALITLKNIKKNHSIREKQQNINEKKYQLQTYLCSKFEQNKKIVYKLMQIQHLNNNKLQLLSQKIKHENFIKLVKKTFIVRSGKIKSKVSIIHYAQNLKRKVINGFFHVKLDKQSSILRQNKLNKGQISSGLLKIQKILQKSRRSDKITDKISRFNMSRSRHALR